MDLSPLLSPLSPPPSLHLLLTPLYDLHVLSSIRSEEHRTASSPACRDDLHLPAWGQCGVLALVMGGVGMVFGQVTGVLRDALDVGGVGGKSCGGG